MKYSQITRRDFLKGACAGTLAAMVPFRGQAAQTKQRPNIVVILSDDQGRGELTLSAPDVPGRQVMEVRVVMLTLLK